MPEKPPYFPLYPKDLIGDDLVRAMTTTEFGAYIKLLCAAWVATPACTIPDDDDVLARLAGLTPAEWMGVKKRTLAPFKKQKNNRWKQSRLAREYKRIFSRKKTRAEAGKRGGLARAAKNKPDGASNAIAKTKQNPSIPEPEPEPEPEPNGFGIGSPQPPKLLDLMAFAVDELRWPLQRLTAAKAVFQDYSVLVVVEGLNYLASRRESSFNSVKNWPGFLRDVLSKIESDEKPEPGGKKGYRTFHAWWSERLEQEAKAT